jgi:hypothetical protein
MARKKDEINSENKAVEIKFVKDETYSSSYVNGAFGGVNAMGDIVVNFYLEKHIIPEKEVIVNGKSHFEPENSNSNFERIIKSEIILSTESAVRIVEWLNSKISASQNIRQDIKKKG